MKRDWTKIKIEFFKSKYTQASSFIREEYGIEPKENGVVTRQIKGWWNEKLELKKIWFEKAKQEIIDLYKPQAEELAQMHQATITLLKAALQKELAEVMGIDVQTGERRILRLPNIALVERIWRIVKTEKSELTAIQKDEADISNEDRNLITQLLDRNLDDE